MMEKRFAFRLVSELHRFIKCTYSGIIHPTSLVLLLISFLFVHAAKAQQWYYLGNDQQVASGTSNYNSLASLKDATGYVPYAAFTEGGIAKVKKYAPAGWVQVGDNVSNATATFTRIYADRDNKLYVLYVDASNGNRLALKSYNPVTLLWEPLNGMAANLYVSTGSVTNSIGQYNSTQRGALAFDTANKPLVVFGDGANLIPYVKSFNGASWETLGGAAVSAERAVGVSIGVDSATNTPYIVYLNQASATSSTGNIVVYRYAAGTWQPVVVPNPVTGGSATSGATTAARHTSLAFNSSWNPVISYFNASNSNRATIVTYNKVAGTWSYGGVISSRDITWNNLYRDKAGNLYNSFADVISNGSGRSVAKVIKQAAGSSTWTELKDAGTIDGIDEPAGSPALAVDEDSSKPYIIYTKSNVSGVITPVVRKYTTTPPPPPPGADSIVTTPRQMEYLTRGVVAVRSNASQVYIGWRLLGTDSASISFNVYRDGVKLNATPVTTSTNYVDNTTTNGNYTIRAVMEGAEFAETPPVTVWANIYKSIPLQIPPPGVTPTGEAYTYNANDCSVGDLDGDGEYEIVLKWDPSNSKDNSQSGYTGNVYLDAYKMNGTRLWRIDLGRNIRAGAHYTQFMVYDLDGDGKAEVACKTADGTIDGAGATIGQANADYRNSDGYILTGPEYLSVFNGLTGAAMATSNYLPARGSVASWGDSYGNRVDRFVNAIAYLDGARPSLIMGRGYYTRLVRAAWDWRNGQLTSRWVFDSNNPGNSAYAGQGNHQLSVGDVDGDGKDEICNGASTINDNGNGLYANGLGHGDALHMTDLDPDRPGQEVWQCHEDPGSYGNYAIEFRDAKTGQPLWGPLAGDNGDVGRAMAADIDPNHKGYEVWASSGALYNCKGVQISTNKPSVNFGIWWDGDLSRELLDGTKLDEWNASSNSSNRLLTIFNYGNAMENNGTKANPGLTADLLGDWREEMIYRSSDNQNLLLFTTTMPTDYRLYTLMHNAQYRVAVAWQNTAYNQPPYPDYYLGTGMVQPPRPNIFVAGGAALPVKLLEFKANEIAGMVKLSWKTAQEKNNEYFTVERSQNSVDFKPVTTVKGSGTVLTRHTYAATDNLPFNGISYYRLKQTDADGLSSYSQVEKVNILLAKNRLIITPNPVTKSVHLEFISSSPNLQLSLSSYDGKLIGKINGSPDQLNKRFNSLVSMLKRGVYFVQLFDGSNRYTEKLVKE